MSSVDGIHFGTGEDMSSGIFDIADASGAMVVNEPEARHHFHPIEQRLPDAEVLWRASPDVKPADLDWDARAFSFKIFESIDFHYQNHGAWPYQIILLNELNLDYERGDAKNDGGAFDTNPDNWPALYRKLSAFLETLRMECVWRAAERGFAPSFWFPAWAPEHGEQNPEIASIWVPVAQRYDGIVMHSYRDTETITNDVMWYLRQFSEHQILLGEWNTGGFEGDRIEEEVKIRARLQAINRSVSPWLLACYFIYRWEQDKNKTYDIKGNPARTAIWDGRVEIPYDPWVPVLVAPEPLPDPEEEIPVAPPVTSLPSGCDVASYQGFPDWNQVAASGLRFAVTKATEGTNYINHTLDHNWRNIKSAGMYRFSYHFGRPDRNTARAEAEFYYSVMQDQGIEPGDGLALDLESIDGSLESARAQGVSVALWTLEFLEHLERLCGFAPLCYTARNVIDEYNFAAFPNLGKYGLWLASWGSQFPTPPAPWEVIAFWQAADDWTVPGIDGLVDGDYFNGPEAAIPLYGLPSVDPAPPVVTPPVEPTPPTGDGGAATRIAELEQQVADLQRILGYSTHGIADALEHGIAEIQAHAGALQAALDELRRQMP